MPGVRDARNESAWLLPNDGSRTNHRLRRDMRRVRRRRRARPGHRRLRRRRLGPDQRLARAGWRVAALDAGPFWDPDADWVSDEAGSHHLYWTEPRVIAAPTRCRWARTTRAGASAARWSTTRATPPVSTRATSPPAPLTGSAPTGRSTTPTCGRTTRHRAGTAGGRGALAVGRPARLPAAAASGRRERRDLPARRAQARDHRQGRPGRDPNGRFGNRPHCIYRGFCLQGCKVNAKASPLITHIPDALAHGAEIRANAWSPRSRSTGEPAGHSACTTCATAASISSGPGWWRWPGTRSRRRGCC